MVIPNAGLEENSIEKQTGVQAWSYILLCMKIVIGMPCPATRLLILTSCLSTVQSREEVGSQPAKLLHSLYKLRHQPDLRKSRHMCLGCELLLLFGLVELERFASH